MYSPEDYLANLATQALGYLPDPHAAGWLADDLAALAALTGHPVRSACKLPGEPDVLPSADALVLGLINEAIGMSIPIVAVPYDNAPLARRPALAASFATLRGAGVTVLDLGRHPEPEAFPWDQVLDALG